MEYVGEEIYKQILVIIEEVKNYPNRALEEYLKALRYQASKYTEQTIKVDIFLKWLKYACFQDFSIINSTESTESQGYFLEFEEIISRQIQDLDSMTRNGQIQDPERYFGLSSPSGETWFNFSVESFLECASRGFFIDSNIFVASFSYLTWKQFSDFLIFGQVYE